MCRLREPLGPPGPTAFRAPASRHCVRFGLVLVMFVCEMARSSRLCRHCAVTQGRPIKIHRCRTRLAECWAARDESWECRVCAMPCSSLLDNHWVFKAGGASRPQHMARSMAGHVRGRAHLQSELHVLPDGRDVEALPACRACSADGHGAPEVGQLGLQFRPKLRPSDANPRPMLLKCDLMLVETNVGKQTNT